MANISIVHTETHDESKPAGSRARSLGDDDIREKDRAIRERIAVDHVSPADESGEAGVGIHKKVTMRVIADPTTYDDVGYVYVKTASGVIELYYKDSAGNITKVTKAGALDGASFGNLANVPAGAGEIPSLNLLAVARLLYPVGSIYISTLSTNPATLLGFGTWTAFAAGRVLVGIDAGQTEFDTAEETGGEKTHILTTEELAAHVHSVNRNSATQNVAFANGSNALPGTGAANSESAGGGGAHNNLQPYIVVYMWKRTV